MNMNTKGFIIIFLTPFIISYVLCRNLEAFGPFSPPSNTLLADDVPKHKESYNPPHRISQSRYCQKSAVCQKLKYSTCLGVKLPYTSTSLGLVSNIETQDDVQKKIQKWKGLMHIPRCWSVIQPFLCALYMPKCDNGLVDLPSKEMCETIQIPCRILQTDNLWPPEFRCNATFESSCANDIRDLRFNTTSECKAPLVRATDEASFYEGVEGCGVQCHNPFFTEEERQDIRTFIKIGSTVSCVCNAFAVLTFLINRPFAGKYPNQAVLWLNLCSFFVALGFSWQFLGSHERTICHADGTLRTSEPSRENLSCVVNFIIVYYFQIADIIWCIIFAYTWLLRSQTCDKIRNKRDKWTSYYHMVAWSIPLVLTVIIAALQQIDGDGLVGICMVGVMNKDMRLIFLLGPFVVLLIACVFIAWCILELIYLKKTSKEVISCDAKNKIRKSINKLTLFLFSIIIFISVTYSCEIYEWNHYNSWKRSFKSYIVCQLNVVGDTEVENCRMQDRPNVSLVQLHLCILFLFHISVAGWIFTYTTAQTWKRFFNEIVLKKEFEENEKLKKHKLISRAYVKTKCLEKKGMNSDSVLSIDIRRSHHDPVGLDFDLNSIGSNENTSWARYIPQFMRRRSAIVPAYSISSQRRNSTDSEISYSVRRVSYESRRHSLDSTVSVQAVGVEVTETVHKRPRNKRRRKNRTRKQSASPEISSSRGHVILENDLETEVLKALKIGNVRLQPSGIPHMNRRMAITDIEKNTIEMLYFGKRFLDEKVDASSASSEESQGSNEHSESETGNESNSFK